MMKVAERVLVSSQSTRRDFLSAVRLQKFSLFFQKSPTVQNLWLKGHENSRPIDNIVTPRGFLYGDSSIPSIHSHPMSYLVSDSPLERLMGVDAACLFTDALMHFLRHKVTVFHVQHSTSCKHNETRWGMIEDRWLIAYCSLASSFHWIFGYFLEIIIFYCTFTEFTVL